MSCYCNMQIHPQGRATMNEESRADSLFCTFIEPTPEDITGEKIRQGIYIVERAYVMVQSIMECLSVRAGKASSLNDMPIYWNSAADIMHTVKKFELYDLSNVNERVGKLIAMVDVVHLAHSCAYQICYEDKKHGISDKYVKNAREVLELLEAYGRIGDAVAYKQIDTSIKH